MATEPVSGKKWQESLYTARDTRQQAEISEVLLSARSVSRQMIARAREQADEIVEAAEKQAAQIISEAREQAEKIVHEAERRSAAPTDTQAAELQEYLVRHMENTFSRLRQQQQEAIEILNEQWRSFLCDMALDGETPKPVESPAAAAEVVEDEPSPPEIGQKQIEARVNAIARELMDIIGKE